jgi:lysophospholipase L1-like esterase
MKITGRSTVVCFLCVMGLAISNSSAGFADDTGAAYIVMGESTDAGFGASTFQKAWISMLQQFLQQEIFHASADLRNYAVFGAATGDISRDQLASGLADVVNYSPVVVSLGSGGNDLLNFISSPEAVTCLSLDIQCLARFNALLNNVEALLDQMVRKLRAAAGPNTPILLRTEHNPFLRDSCGGPTTGLAQLANLALEGSDAVPLLTSGLNDRIRGVAARYNAKVIEVFWIFASNANDLIADDCIHPDDAGHAAIYAAAVSAFLH